MKRAFSAIGAVAAIILDGPEDTAATPRSFLSETSSPTPEIALPPSEAPSVQVHYPLSIIMTILSRKFRSP